MSYSPWGYKELDTTEVTSAGGKENGLKDCILLYISKSFIFKKQIFLNCYMVYRITVTNTLKTSIHRKKISILHAYPNIYHSSEEIFSPSKTWVQSLNQEDPQEEGRTIYSSILAWRIPSTEESGELQSMGSQRVRHN